MFFKSVIALSCSVFSCAVNDFSQGATKVFFEAGVFSLCFESRGLLPKRVWFTPCLELIVEVLVDSLGTVYLGIDLVVGRA